MFTLKTLFVYIAVMNHLSADRLVSPRNLAEAIGMSESSLKRWADQGLLKVTKTVGGHRRISVRDAIHFVRDRGIRFLKPTVIGLPADDLTFAVDDKDLNATLLEHLSEGDSDAVWNLLIGRFLDGTTIAQLGDGAIKSALRELGSRWEHDSNGIFIEHRATDICTQIIQQMRLLATHSSPTFRATGGAVQSDPYMLPSMLVSSVISENGGHPTNLGPNTPVDVLKIDSVKRPKAERPKLVWISASVLDSPEEISREINQFARECHEADIRLIVGGREATDLSLEHIPGLSVHASLESVAKVAAEIASS